MRKESHVTPQLEQYLLTHIPISAHMQLQIVEFNRSQLAIRAPLLPNTNDKGTAFAGSLYSTMVLAGWMYVTARLKLEEIDAEAVATAAEIRYLKPVTTDFQAVCRLPDETAWSRFVAKLQKRKNYKLHLPVEIAVDGELKTSLTGEYHAWMKSLSPYGTTEGAH
jgi:thioesterase domain-containing protein